jgi:beta-glucosidase
MLAKLTLERKIELLGGIDGAFVRALPEIGLGRLKISDGPMGIRQWGVSTGYAGGIGLAASWDTELAHRAGAAIGQDARARGVHFLCGPGINIYRAPMNGRNFEYYGEDPYLAGRLAVEFIRGVQRQGVIATVKHYAANNSDYDRHNVNSIIDERTLREIYLPAFEAAVKEGHAGSVMDSYNLINGEHATENAFLNNEILKKEWGFRGVLMSDWSATYDGVAAANGGLDLEEPSPDFMNRETLLPAIQSGKVTMATIDDKVRRILRTAIEFGFFDREQTDVSVPLYNQPSRQAAFESAQESIVLLKNEGNQLPLDAHRIHSIAVIGPDAYPAVPSGGGSAQMIGFAPVSFLAGLSDALGSNAKVYWSRGVKDVREVFGAADFFGGSPHSRFFTDEAGTHPGLQQEEFSNPDFEGKPNRVRTVPIVNGSVADQWIPATGAKISVRWEGYYIPQTSGPQRFIAVASGVDAAYRLYVDNKMVLEETPHEGQAPQAVDVDLPAGKPAAVRFEYMPKSERRLMASMGVIPAEEMLEPNVKKIAAMADEVVLTVGFNSQTEGEGHDRTYQLPPGQDELIKTVLAANPHTIVVLTAGGSVDTHQWIDKTHVLLHTWYGGEDAGRALARVLLGQANPSGKLPISWERRIEDNPTYANYYEAPGSKDVNYKEGIFLGYRYYDRSDTKPLFPFGFGLSYTTFAFSNLSVTPAQASAKGPITVSFDVRNTGQRAGTEVAQVYVGDPSATVPRPVKELKGFARAVLNPGESKHLSLTLDRRSLAYWDVTSKDWKVDPGEFVIYVGDSSTNVPLRGKLSVH